MPERTKAGSRQPARLDDEVEKFVNKMEKLYREKPAGYFAYLATCGSAMKLSDFTHARPVEPKVKKG